ncbi:lymphocyte-specific protein 1 [Saccopteryx bilineata]|uniref:lymphocyte-specific protein 1 n=1 Tax=Saccopteryx bilineata TaxID=59482 RepID=UPI00338FF9BD
MAEAPSHPEREEQEELLMEEGTGPAAQWNLDDEEEAAQERRRQERDQDLGVQDQDGGSPAPLPLEQEKLLEASETPEVDEDEGFGDWTQKPELRRGPPQEESPEGETQNGPRGNQDEDELSPTGVGLEELQLGCDSEPRCGLDPEQREPRGPGGTSPGRLSPAEPPEAEGQYPTCQQPRTPSPLVLEENAEPGSPPLSPSTKLIDRTESLSRSIEKSNSVKRSQPALPISKIDERLEQYTQAIETAGRTHKLTRQPSIELPSMAVASSKSLWETGEVQAQSAAKAPACKDIVAGDMSKKGLWEQKGGPKTSSTVKSTASGKRYKFVATGHGKYEKVLMDEGSAP